MPPLIKRTDRGGRWLSRAKHIVLFLTAVFPANGYATAATQEKQLIIGSGWQEISAPLANAARLAGAARLASLIEGWALPDEATTLDRQLIVIPSTSLQTPNWVNKGSSEIWQQFVDLRRQRADIFFAAASDEIRRLRRPAGNKRPVTPTEAVRLLFRVLRENPAHEGARRTVGYVNRSGLWLWPTPARRLGRREVFSASHGWQPRGRHDYLLNHQATDIEGLGNEMVLQLSQAERFDSDHWQIRTTAGLAAASQLAARLETTRLIWLQAFGGFAYEVTELQRRLTGRGSALPSREFKAVLMANRRQYINQLEGIEPRIAKTLGIYWNPTRTTWLFHGDELPARTIEHEATHQLFAESRRTSPAAGSRHGIWALEAVACYMESLEETPFGFTLGGRTTGRVPAAYQRLVEDGFFIPLRELDQFDRTTLQADPRLPQIYSQISGLANFFINGEQGRYRDAFLAYLLKIYLDTAQPNTLWELCGCTPEELDESYRRAMAQQ